MSVPDDAHEEPSPVCDGAPIAPPSRNRNPPKERVVPIAANDVAALAGLARGQRLLGFDLGTKTIGLALSDVERSLASPLETIARTKFTAEALRLQQLVLRYTVGGLVIGLPVNMDGSEGPRAQATRAFARNLTRLIALPVAFWDERLSTAAVTRTLIEADATRARRAAVVDRLAAAYILQGALDRLRTEHRTSNVETA